MLRANSRPRASADLGYRILAGVVAGGFAELLGVNLARDRCPGRPDYLTVSLVAAAVGVAVAIIDPPDERTSASSGRQGDAWLDPEGRLHPAPYGHNQGASDILGASKEGYGPTEEELRCCGVDLDVYDEEEVDEIPWNPGCVAEARLRDQGWQRVKGEYSREIGFELFSEPTSAQRNTLRRISAGPNLDRTLHVDVAGDPCNDDEPNMANFTAPANSVRERHEVIDKAIACVNGEGPAECRGYGY